ncbi:MAG: PilZ domain-containing protein [Lachnospiraceae bacterium]|nr:PilZ domain-containing protein [Lachnospiraceae bacterium]
MQLNNVRKGTEIVITCELDPSVRMEVTAVEQMDIDDILITTCAYDDNNIPICPNEDIIYDLLYNNQYGTPVTIEGVAISFDDVYNTYAVQYIEMLTVKKQRGEVRISYDDVASCHFGDMNLLYLGMIHDVSKSGIGIRFPAGTFTEDFQDNEQVNIMFDSDTGKKIRIIGKWRYSLAEEDGNIRCGFRLIKISQTYKDLVEMLLEFSENSER